MISISIGGETLCINTASSSEVKIVHKMLQAIQERAVKQAENVMKDIPTILPLVEMPVEIVSIHPGEKICVTGQFIFGDVTDEI